MRQPKEIRQSHLDLKDKCIERIFETQYRQSGYSYYLKGLLAHILDTNIPLRNKDGVRALLAHACNNAKCANPKHLYWATDKENILDSGSFYERNLKKNVNLNSLKLNQVIKITIDQSINKKVIKFLFLAILLWI